jgi:glycosyltransferase involved in cell wall biosynthesis
LDAVAKNENLSYEIVVVDDGSNDETYKRAIKYAQRNNHVKVISYEENVGKGHAVRTGILETTGEIVIFTDGDREINFDSIQKYIEALQHADIVIASKRHPDSVVIAPRIRKILSSGFMVLVRILTGANLKDTQVGLKLMKRSAVNSIFPRLAVKRYAFDVELLAVAHLYGLKVVEMPVNIKFDSSFKVEAVWHMFIDLLGIAYRLRVIHWYQHQTPTKNGLQNLASSILRET